MMLPRSISFCPERKFFSAGAACFAVLKTPRKNFCSTTVWFQGAASTTTFANLAILHPRAKLNFLFSLGCRAYFNVEGKAEKNKTDKCMKIHFSHSTSPSTLKCARRPQRKD